MNCSNINVNRQNRISETRDQLTALIAANTNVLEQIGMLLGERKTLETALDSRQKRLGTELAVTRQADVRERGRLVQLVQLQAQEVEALKEEIGLLSRKGGHILPPAAAPPAAAAAVTPTGFGGMSPTQPAVMPGLDMRGSPRGAGVSALPPIQLGPLVQQPPDSPSRPSPK